MSNEKNKLSLAGLVAALTAVVERLRQTNEEMDEALREGGVIANALTELLEDNNEIATTKLGTVALGLIKNWSTGMAGYE